MTDAVQLSSLVVGVPQERADQVLPSLDTLSVYVSPFVENREVVAVAAPALCVSCGAYASAHNARVGTHLHLQCLFCEGHIVNSYSTPQAAEDHAVHFIEFEERQTTFTPLTQIADSTLHIFAIDSILFQDNTFVERVKQVLLRFPPSAKVMFVVLDDLLRLVRVGDHSMAPLAIDVFPASTGSFFSSALSSTSASRALKSLQPALYVCNAEFIHDHIDQLFSALVSTFQPNFSSKKNIKSSQAPVHSLNALVIIAAHLRNSREKEASAASRVHVCLLAHRDFRLREHKDNQRLSLCGLYSSWGRRALRDHCAFFAVQFGLAARHAASIESFASASGGLFLASELVDDAPLDCLLQHMIAVASGSNGPSATDIASVTVRSSRGLEVDRLHSSLLSTDELIALSKERFAQRKDMAAAQVIDGAASDSNSNAFSDNQLYINPLHFGGAWQRSQEIHNPSINNADQSLKDQQTAFAKVVDRCKKEIALCGVTAREGRDSVLHLTARAVQSKSANLSKSTTEGVPRVGFWSRLQSFSTNVFQVDSARPDQGAHSQGSGLGHADMRTVSPELWNNLNKPCIPTTSTANCEFVQIVVRSSRWNIDSMRNLEQIFQTRVWTLRIGTGAPVKEILDQVDVHLWALGAAKTVTADFHDAVEAAFDGPRPHQCSEKDYDKYKVLKMKYHQLIDTWIKSLAIEWKPSGEKLMLVLRYVYHLLEGPLLDGPSASYQEAHVLRTLFLRSSLRLCRPLLMPRVTLDASKLSQQLSRIDMPAESISLLPNTIALVDCGEIIVVRCNQIIETSADQPTSIDDQQSHSRAMLSLEALAQSLAQNRCPPARVIVLQSSGSPADRLVFSRLSPSHTDGAENVFERLQHVEAFQSFSLTIDDIKAMISTMPFTDQLFFQKFLSVKAGIHYSRLSAQSPASTQTPPPPLANATKAPIATFVPPVVHSQRIDREPMTIAENTVLDV